MGNADAAIVDPSREMALACPNRVFAKTGADRWSQDCERSGRQHDTHGKRHNCQQKQHEEEKKLAAKSVGRVLDKIAPPLSLSGAFSGLNCKIPRKKETKENGSQQWERRNLGCRKRCSSKGREMKWNKARALFLA